MWRTDVTATNGRLSNFTGSGRNYTADLTVNNSGATFTATVQVAAGMVTDVAGNASTTIASLAIPVVARPPPPTTATPTITAPLDNSTLQTAGLTAVTVSGTAATGATVTITAYESGNTG